MIKLRCVVEHITYQNPENGRSVMKVNVKGYNGIVYPIQNKTISKRNPKLKERLNS